MSIALNWQILFIFSVDGEVINSIGKGLCVLVGITRKDKAGEMDYLWVLKVQISIYHYTWFGWNCCKSLKCAWKQETECAVNK